MHHARHAHFIPAAGLRVLTPLYDQLLRMLGLGSAFRDQTLDSLAPSAGERILDLGVGTGTLAIQLKRRCPGANVVGVDIDEQVLALAERKATAAGVTIELKNRSADDTGEPSDSFDRVVSSLMVHHLPTATKVSAVKEVFRILRPGGKLLLVDFGPPPGVAGTLLGRLLSNNYFEETGDNFAGRLPRMLEQAGFENVHTLKIYKHLVHFIEGQKPA